MTATRLVRLAALAVTLALGAGGLYRLLAPPAPPLRAHTAPSSTAAAAHPTELREDLNMARRREAGGAGNMIDAYRAWAGRANTVDARKLLLATLLSEPNLALKLSNALAAIDADPTPPEQDPLWPAVAEYLANLWTPETASNALDLMFAETRPRARRALISSFALLATSERFETLPAPQRQKLTNYFIDMYDGVAAAQKSEVERALRNVAGNDVADILLRKGLGNGDLQLESEREYEQGLAEVQQMAAKTGP